MYKKDQIYNRYMIKRIIIYKFKIKKFHKKTKKIEMFIMHSL